MTLCLLEWKKGQDGPNASTVLLFCEDYVEETPIPVAARCKV